MDTPIAYLKGTRLIIWDTDQANKIYSLGFFGKPIGISKVKNSDFDSHLILDLIEAIFLLEKNKLIICNNKEQSMNLETLIEYAKKTYNLFQEKLLVYKDLRRSEYIVTSGMKFGSDFAVYKHGPGIDHAPFIVSVSKADTMIDSTEIVRAGRLATTVKKRFIIAVPNLKTGIVNYLLFKWWKA